MDFSKIKLVIWDLDNTFWEGIISEMEISPIQRNLSLIKDLTDCGVINSICSKNTFDVCREKLVELEVFDYFVFPSIDWTPKGHRVKQLIKTMSLRAENVLFIDDDVTNLGEAKHYSPNLMVAEPTIIDELVTFVNSAEKKDTDHKRLNQYKLLETKDAEQKKYDSNEDFLFSSNVRVVIHENCKPEAERVHELLMRSNQLNFTKNRISLDELNLLFDNENYRCGYVTVNDRFGEYGIVGFYALTDERLEHFLFSCRTIGLGIEQYVYSILGCPALEVSGEVVSVVQVKAAPAWINNGLAENVDSNAEKVQDEDVSILIKGPCDLAKSMTYIKNSDKFSYEFTYVNDLTAQVIEAHNHSVHITGLFEYNEQEKQQIAEDCIFVDKEMFNGTMFKSSYNIVFLSTLIESNYGIYQHKETKAKVAFGSYLSPLTDKSCWEDYVAGNLYTAGNKFTIEYLQKFADKYDFIGKTNPIDYIERLKLILQHLDKKTSLCLILGVEIPCEKYMEYDFKERHISHKALNDAIRLFAKTSNRIKLIDLNDVVLNQNDFTSNINHYTSRIYYEISRKIADVIQSETNSKVQGYSKVYIYLDVLLGVVKSTIKAILNKNNPLFKGLYSVYKKTGRTKKQ